MFRMPLVLKNFNLHIEGIGYAGRIEKFTPPKIVVKTAQQSCGGFDTPVEVDMGIETLKATWTMAEWSSEVINLVAIIDGTTRVTAYGALNDDTSPSAIPVVVEMTGAITESDPGAWEVGKKTAHKYSMSLRYLKISTNGMVNVEIDIENMKRIIGGTDQVESIRSAINF